MQQKRLSKVTGPFFQHEKRVPDRDYLNHTYNLGSVIAQFALRTPEARVGLASGTRFSAQLFTGSDSKTTNAIVEPDVTTLHLNVSPSHRMAFRKMVALHLDQIAGVTGHEAVFRGDGEDGECLLVVYHASVAHAEEFQESLRNFFAKTSFASQELGVGSRKVELRSR